MRLSRPAFRSPGSRVMPSVARQHTARHPHQTDTTMRTGRREADSA